MLGRRAVLAGGASILAAPALITRAHAAEKVVKIGNTMPYSGPASSYAAVGKADAGFFKMVNEHGGVSGHKVDFISLDDSYSPPKTVEDVRRLNEQDRVDFLFNTLGTPCNTAIERYCNSRKLPQLFVATGANKWGNYKKYPWTIGWQPSYRVEAQIYTKYMLKEHPKAKLGILYQNDDFGKDYPLGVRDILGKDWGKTVVKATTYETTDATIDSQITELKASGADAILVAAIPKFAAQAIKKVHNLNWHPMFFLTNVSISVGGVMDPAGPQNGVGIISTLYLKDPADPSWDNDTGMKDFKAFMGKYVPGGDIKDGAYIAGYGVTYTMWKVMEQCNGNFSRKNVMKEVTNLKNLEVPVLLPGIKVNTSPTNYHPILALQPARWTGSKWQRFGGLIEGVAT